MSVKGKIAKVIRNKIYIESPDLDLEKSYLTGKITAGSNKTCGMQSNEGFTNGVYVALGRKGDEKSEISKINLAVSGNTNVRVDTVKYEHAFDSPISRIRYNQVQVAKASTKAGTKTTLATAAIEMDDNYTVYDFEGNSVVSTDYLFIRYKHSADSEYSDWSDAVIATGYGERVVKKIISKARNFCKEKTQDLVNDDELIDEINGVFDDLETKKKEWKDLQRTETFNLTAGISKYTCPSDLAGYDADEGLRIGSGKFLDYIDKREYEQEMEGVGRSELSGIVNLAHISVKLRDTSGLDTSGQFIINGDTATYSGKTNTYLTGVSGVSATHNTGAELIQKDDCNEPTKWSLWQDKILLSTPPEKRYVGYFNYYRTIPRVSDIYDEIDFPNVQIIVDKLKGYIFGKQGETAKANFYEAKYEAKSNLLIKKTKSKQRPRFTADDSYRYDKGGDDAKAYEDEILGGN